MKRPNYKLFSPNPQIFLNLPSKLLNRDPLKQAHSGGFCTDPGNMSTLRLLSRHHIITCDIGISPCNEKLLQILEYDLESVKIITHAELPLFVTPGLSGALACGCMN